MEKVTVGGQALIEGIMMKTKEKKAITVRLKDGTTKTVVTNLRQNKLSKIPFIRGIYALFSSIISGTKDLNYSASFIEEEGENKEKDNSNIDIFLSAFLSFAIAIAMFSVFPSFVTKFFNIENKFLFALVEGFIKISIFIIYIYLMTKIEDVNRVFMYHGAEHKCVFAYERGLELTVENVRKMPRLHPRCGTNFIFIVLMVSIIFNAFISVEFIWQRILIKLLILPIITGVSYEIIKLAAKSDNIVFKIISFPGLVLQNLTTKEPDDNQIEVGIIATKNCLNLI